MPPASVLTPAAEGVLQRWPVSKRVNSSKAPKDEQSLTQSVDVEASQFPVQQLELPMYSRVRRLHARRKLATVATGTPTGRLF